MLIFKTVRDSHRNSNGYFNSILAPMARTPHRYLKFTIVRDIFTPFREFYVHIPLFFAYYPHVVKRSEKLKSSTGGLSLDVGRYLEMIYVDSVLP